MDIDDFLDNAGKEKKDKLKEAVDPLNSDKTDKQLNAQDKILTLIAEVKQLMSEQKFEPAERKYVEAKEAFAQFTQKQLDVQNMIYSDLESINKSMVLGLNSLKEECEKKIDVIQQLLEKIHEHLNNNQLQLANQLFTQVDVLYKNLPNIMLDRKIHLEQELSSIHIALSQKNNLESTKEFQTKFANIKNLLAFGFQNVQAGKLTEALEFYHRINSLYEELPKGFLYEKAILYEQILKLFKSVQHTHRKATAQNELISPEKKGILNFKKK